MTSDNRALAIEAQWTSLVDQAPDGIFVADLEGRYVEVNKAGCRMLGYEREELIGKSIVDLIPLDRVSQLEQEKERLLRGDEVVSEWPLRKKNGTWLHVEVSAKILPDGRWQGLVRDVTERRRLEAALQASHADLVRAQSVAHVGSWRFDAVSNVVQWSREEYEIFGVPPDAPLSFEAFLAIVHPDDRAWVEREWKAAVRGKPYDFEHRVIVRGKVRWVREKADLEFDENGAFIGGIGITLDITDRKRREEELRITRERLELALRGADLAMWDWNVASGEVILNARWAEMRGYRPDEIGNNVDSWISDVHPDDWPKVKEALEEHFAGKRDEYESEHRIRMKSGGWLWILDRGRVFARNERGEPLRMAGTALDISERKQIELEQKLLDEVGSALATTLDYEETVSKIAELAARDLADLCIVDILEEDGELRRSKVRSRESTQQSLSDELKRFSPNRTRAPLLWSVLETKTPALIQHVTPETFSEEHLRVLRPFAPMSAVLVPLMAHTRVLGVLTLVSSTRTYGPADLNVAVDLAYRAALSIENARLYLSAKKAIQDRDDVLGVVAHDLRNPLNSILIQAAMLRPRGGDHDRRSRKPADVIERAVNRMNRLIDDLLDVTQMEAGHFSLERARLPPTHVIHHALEVQRPMASAASLELDSDVPTELPEVCGDRDRLLQVFENLVGNAVKFTEPGGCVTVGAESQGDDVLFWVSDTGIGISAADVSHLFDRFWQARKSRRRGAGLGLPIAKGIIEAHGGRIWVESAPGRGTTFFFTIPKAPARTQ